MKKITILLLALFFMLIMSACVKSDEETITTFNTEAAVMAETEANSEVLKYLEEKYDLKFTLWGPEGQDLYAFHIYADHAERECHILMPANTEDVSEFHENLSWKVVGDELIISGAWEETFIVDISAETATSAETGKVYKIYKMQDPAA